MAKPGNAAKKKAWRTTPKAKAYGIAYWANNEGALRAKVLAKRMSAALERLKRGKTSESATTILGQITTYVKSLPDDRLAYIFMSSEDETSIKRETKKNKEKIVTMGGKKRRT